MKLQAIRVSNYRVLRDVELNDLGSFTVLCGANGSSKSTLIDVFAFLHEAFTDGLRQAWDQDAWEALRDLVETAGHDFSNFSAPRTWAA